MRETMGIIDAHCHLPAEDIGRMLTDMDACGVERAVVCPERRHIVVDNAGGNDLVAKAQRLHPDRLTGLAVANPWYGARAVSELRRAREMGLTGLKINSAIQGFSLLDPMVKPLIAFAAEAGWPVYCHTGTPVHALPMQVCELAELFPGVDFVLGHCGFCDSWNDITEAVRRCPRVYLETSYVNPSQLTTYLEAAGRGRMLFGSDAPHSSLSWEVAKAREIEASPEILADVLGGNAERLFWRRP
ncbi:MAG: amidohydrolase family protein [Planctomycetota bacterium]